MYYIEVGLGRRYRVLAIFFSCCGLIGCLTLFQTNQLAEILSTNYSVDPWITGALSAAIVASVIFGGIKRIARWSEAVVPTMCFFYVTSCLYILATRIEMVPQIFLGIVHDAFTGTAAVGGVAGITVSHVIATGVKRAAFSNEAGIGTAPMAHGAAKTDEPVREGLVAMLGPFIDTIVVCSMTAFVILSSDHWRQQGESETTLRGVSLTAEAFQSVFGPAGNLFVAICVALFALSTMVGYAYYGRKCFSYLMGAHRGRYYDMFYIVMLFVGAVWSAESVINLLDTAFALMALPNMIATLLLAPHVLRAARDYFDRYDVG